MTIKSNTSPSTKTKFSERFIAYEHGYSRFKKGFENTINDEPKNFDEEEKYKDEVQKCVAYRIEYFSFFNEAVSWRRPQDWQFYDEIVETSIEERFPRDQDIRALILAYRQLFERNQMSNVIRKRTLGLIWLCVIFAPFVIFIYFPQFFMGAIDINNYTLQLVYFSIPIFLACAAGATVAYFGLLANTTNNLRNVLQANAAHLGQLIQKRLDKLNNLYDSYLSKISDEEVAQERGGLDPTWPERARWDMQLAIWFSKRLEYIEKTLQLEMQRLRLFMIISDPLGNLSALILFLSVTAVPLVAFVVKKSAYSPVIQTAWIVAYALAALVTGLGIRLSTTGRYSIEIKNIRDWVISDKWATYQELDVITKIGEAIRKSKEDYRQLREQLAGKGVK